MGIVILCFNINIYIKNNNFILIFLQLQLYETYEQFFTLIEKQLQNGLFPMILCKNITKEKETKGTIFWTPKSTFIIELKTKVIHSLQKLVGSTNVVSIICYLYLHIPL